MKSAAKNLSLREVFVKVRIQDRVFIHTDR